MQCHLPIVVLAIPRKGRSGRNPHIGAGPGARTYLSRLRLSSISYGNAVSFGKALEHSDGTIESRSIAYSIERQSLAREEEIRRLFVLSIVGRGIDLKRLSHPGEVISLMRATLDGLKENGVVCVDGGRLKLTQLGLIQAAAVGLRMASLSVELSVSQSIAERQKAG